MGWQQIRGVGVIPLPYIITSPPGTFGIDTWSYDHWQDHLEITQEIFTQNIANLPTYDILNINPDDVQSWLERHQQFHNDANGALGTPGTDLTAVDWNDDAQRRTWFWLNFMEHQQLRQVLKI